MPVLYILENSCASSVQIGESTLFCIHINYDISPFFSYFSKKYSSTTSILQSIQSWHRSRALLFSNLYRTTIFHISPICTVLMEAPSSSILHFIQNWFLIYTVLFLNNPYFTWFFYSLNKTNKFDVSFIYKATQLPVLSYSL